MLRALSFPRASAALDRTVLNRDHLSNMNLAASYKEKIPTQSFINMNFLIPVSPISSTVNRYSKVMEKEKVLYGYLHKFAINSSKVKKL